MHPSPRMGRKFPRKSGGMKEFERYSNSWWVARSIRFENNKLYIWGRGMSRQILMAQVEKRKNELSLAVKEKLMDLSKRKQSRNISVIVNAFVFRGADDIIIHILNDAKLFSWAGHVWQNRGKYSAAGLMYFQAGDERNLRRMIKKIQVKGAATGKEDIANLEHYQKLLEHLDETPYKRDLANLKEYLKALETRRKLK